MSELQRATADPCLTCSIGQDCCAHLKGLTLSGAEYERCFAPHAGRLVVRRLGPLYVLSSRDGGACPNWREGRCSVYEVRPMECRLFPYTVEVLAAHPRRMRLGFHSRTRCPAKRQLLPPEDVARRMVSEWARQAFPGIRIGRVRRDTRLARVLRLSAAAAGRLLRLLRDRK